ncbi:MAG: Ig-like domain-containing protein, partial [Vicinamibacterales bacterium]|nr:Ig-like domain-containing protein [Vicinamibacterales bacterium]
MGSYVGTWIHVVATYSGNHSSSGIRLYLNGIQVDDANDNSGSYAGMPDTSVPVNIGGYEALSDYTDGAIDEVRIYSRELSAAEVSTLHGAGRAAPGDTISSSGQVLFMPFSHTAPAWEQIAQPAADEQSYTDNNLLANTFYEYRVQAVNSEGSSEYSEVASVQTPDESPTQPNVALTAPADGSQFSTPTDITLAATASDPDGTITEVRFLADGSQLGSAATSPYSFQWTNVAAGTYALSAVVEDNDQNVATSQPVNVTVSTPPQNQAPVVSAGADANVILPATASLNGTVTDDGLPNPPGAVSLTWSTLSGPGTVSFADASAVDTTASFSIAGSYVLRLTADDSALNASDDVSVTVAVPGGPPAAPSGLSAQAISAISVGLAWTDNANNETGFVIEQREGHPGAAPPDAWVEMPDESAQSNHGTLKPAVSTGPTWTTDADGGY